MIVIIIFLVILITVFFLKCNGLNYYTLKSSTHTPCTVILSATHGNEPAGFFALHRFLDSNPQLKRGRVIVIPSANPCGLLTNRRNNPLGDYDINRNYPKNTFLNAHLKTFVDKADWVIDLHEGWGFHKLDKRSVGSGVYGGNTKESLELSEKLIRGINTKISEPYKKFSTFNIPNVKGSLRDYCNQTRKHYILVETSGIGDIQPMELRVEQQLYLIQSIVNYLHNK